MSEFIYKNSWSVHSCLQESRSLANQRHNPSSEAIPGTNHFRYFDRSNKRKLTPSKEEDLLFTPFFSVQEKRNQNPRKIMIKNETVELISTPEQKEETVPYPNRSNKLLNIHSIKEDTCNC